MVTAHNRARRRATWCEALRGLLWFAATVALLGASALLAIYVAREHVAPIIVHLVRGLR